LKSSKLAKQDIEAKESEHYCYICVKRHDADRLAKDNWQAVVEEIIKEESEQGGDEDDE
jgi:hypothetical protein